MRIIVEANIGSGKTTLLKKLEETLGEDINVIYEPVDCWTKIQDSNGENLLGYFYQDIKRWAYTFQSVAFRTRIQEMEKKLKNDSINIIERSVYTDRNVFAKNCHANGLMNDIEWCDYTNWHDWLCSKFDIKPDLYIYLRVDPEVSYSRLQKRSRHEEEGVPLDYLRQIHQKHEDWLTGLDNVIVIDGNIEFETDPTRLNEIVEIIKNTIENKAGGKKIFGRKAFEKKIKKLGNLPRFDWGSSSNDKDNIEFFKLSDMCMETYPCQHDFIVQLKDGTLKIGGISGGGSIPEYLKKHMTERQIRHLS